MSVKVSVIVAIFQFLSGASSLFLRVETGHQNIAISGRDPYFGHFTRIHFQNLTCVAAIHVHCLKPLTGAEEIDLVYSECSRGQWKVAHYTNSKNYFRLKTPINVQRLSISSRKELSVIDVQVESCAATVLPTTSPSCHNAVRGHVHRHGRTEGTLRATDDVADESHSRFRRPKRSAEPEVFDSGVHIFHQQLEIGSDTTVTVLPGTILRFAEDAGISVKGRLLVNGTFERPVIFEPIDGSWKGIAFENGARGSIISHANISRGAIGIAIYGGNAPYLDHVIVDQNHVGMDINLNNPLAMVKLNKVIVVNNAAAGISSNGKV